MYCRASSLPRAVRPWLRVPVACFSTKPYFVTTPVFYSNSLPHIGHLYTCALADAYARHARLTHPGGSFLSTGTDEHGQKVEAAAQAQGVTPGAWCDSVSGSFAACVGAFHISAQAFTRTTSVDHGRVVRWMWRRLAARGHIYLGTHEGWYCPAEEAFLTAAQTCTRQAYLERRGLAGGAEAAGGAAAAALTPQQQQQLAALVSVESGHPVEWVSEDNYKFRLAAQAPALLAHYAEHPTFVLPRQRLTDIAAFVASGEVRDLSVSRPRDRVAWAWSTPPDTPATADAAAAQQPSKHSIYVWLDALCSYLTATLDPAHQHAAAQGSSSSPAELPDHLPWSTLFPLWPADLHVVGKDIVKFHALYWPAFLAAAGMPLPRCILAHGHFTVGRQKMSKSLGNCVDPMALLLPPPSTQPAVPAGAAGAAAAAPAPAPASASEPLTPLPFCGGPYTVDGVRFALLREGIVSEDGDFNPSTLEQRASKECADTFGNLASRLLTAKFMPVEGSCCIAPVPLALPWGSSLAAGGLQDPWGTAWGQAASAALGSSSSSSSSGAAQADPSTHPAAQPLPLTPELVGLLSEVDGLLGAMEAGMAAGEGPSPGLAATVACLQGANRLFTRAEPWKRVARKEEVAQWREALQEFRERSGSGGSSSSLQQLLPPGQLQLQPATLELAALAYTLAETLRISAIVLQLATPGASLALLGYMGFGAAQGGRGALLGSWRSARVGAARPHDIRLASAQPLPVLFPKAPVLKGKP
jgi:methionine--tRNA ligase